MLFAVSIKDTSDLLRYRQNNAIWRSAALAMFRCARCNNPLYTPEILGNGKALPTVKRSTIIMQRPSIVYDNKAMNTGR